MAIDITDRVEMEAALKDADRRQDEFLAVLAHELRNPLTPLLNGLQILRQPAPPQAQVQTRDMMKWQLRHLVRLVDDLFDVSRISRGKVQLRCERIDLARHTRTAAEDRRPVLEQAGPALAVDLVPAQAGQHVSGPAGYAAQGEGGYPAGTLLGRVGEGGPVFVVGQQYEGRGGQGGRLYLRVVPLAGGSGSTGAYQVKVSTGPGLEVEGKADPQALPPWRTIYLGATGTYGGPPPDLPPRFGARMKDRMKAK
jgi:hypothetical protein